LPTIKEPVNQRLNIIAIETHSLKYFTFIEELIKINVAY
jgi:hypothetical protein